MKPRGLTLVELLIAMGILVTITTSTMLIFRGVSQAWRSGHMKTERYQQARLLFDLFTRELTSAVANARYPLRSPSADAERIKAAGVHDELFFIGALPGRSGLIERGYWVTETGQLMCHDEEPADADYATGTDEVCGTSVNDFAVAFFDGAAWVDDWDAATGGSHEGQIPRAIRITLSLGAPRAESFDTVIYLPTATQSGG